jgi:hypothetical protein
MLAGITFLVLVVVTMIKYAAIDLDHTWILWVFCIMLGAALITGIAFFEKRRSDVLAAVKELRQWQR